jgi:peptidoglycan/xylan/chitin deacetylase (PgdA/CDA1 family)
MAAAFASPYRWLSPGGAKARLSVFIFHRVLPGPDYLQPDEPDAARFERIVRFLATWFDVMPLGEAARRLQARDLPPAAAAITFDDGYADNLAIAAPILRRHGLAATFFVASGYLDGGRMWNDSVMEAMRVAPRGTLDCGDLGLGACEIDGEASRLSAFRQLRDALKYRSAAERKSLSDEIARRSGLPAASDLMMTSGDVVRLRDLGMEIGGHTVTHPILATLDAPAAAKEIADNRDRLGQLLGQAPAVFAYPNGSPGKDYTERDVGLVRQAGYHAAVAVGGGYSTADTDPFQLARFTPWDRDMLRFGLRCGLNLASRPGVRPADGTGY